MVLQEWIAGDPPVFEMKEGGEGRRRGKSGGVERERGKNVRDF